MAADPHLQAVAALVQRGFRLNEIWNPLPWDGDMPEDYIEAFLLIIKRQENERVQRFAGL